MMEHEMREKARNAMRLILEAARFEVDEVDEPLDLSAVRENVCLLILCTNDKNLIGQFDRTNYSLMVNDHEMTCKKLLFSLEKEIPTDNCIQFPPLSPKRAGLAPGRQLLGRFVGDDHIPRAPALHIHRQVADSLVLDLICHKQAASIHERGQMSRLSTGSGSQVEDAITRLWVQQRRGGHGGQDPITLIEPFVMVGAGVKPGEFADINMVDIAPTVAALLGANIPLPARDGFLPICRFTGIIYFYKYNY
jgi:hypothetical protein